MENKNPLLQTASLNAGYGKEIVVGDVTFSVEQGEILCLIGPNGSGKSTVLKTLLSQIQSLGGRISIVGKDLDKMKESEIAGKISMVMTERIRPDFMTCLEVVETGRYPYTGRLGLLTDDDKKICLEAIKKVGALDISHKAFSRISDGQKQRIMLARAIAQQTKIIVLDEPTSFLDMRYKIDLIRIIKSLAKEEGKCIIMSLHELDLVKALADRIICIGGGKVIKIGSRDEVFCGNFIQKLYGIKDNEFDAEKAMLKLSFENKAEKFRPGIIMIQGTMSSAGKSLIAAGLCRIFKEDGWKVAPFKSQNMALNSYVTEEGLEMGRAQVMQAEAAGIKASVLMNPVLLKPTSDRKSQVIVKGEVVGDMDAKDYFSYKKTLMPQILDAFEQLAKEYDIIVIEGAGSPAEINLKENDIVNMGLARAVNAPVLLVGDIDRGGVFAQLLGTMELLTEEEKSRVQGLIINKFRGDESLLKSGQGGGGIARLEALTEKSVCGIVPYMKLSLDDEDSLTSRFEKKSPVQNGVNIGVIRLPYISNFSDFLVFEQFEGPDGNKNSGLPFALHYLDEYDFEKIPAMDMIIIPGSKNSITDMKWLTETGLAEKIKAFKGIIFGICGGFQMLGKEIQDPYGVENGGSVRALGLLNVITRLERKKHRTQVEEKVAFSDEKNSPDFFDFLNGRTIQGYEIHMGKTESLGKDLLFFPGGFSFNQVFGTYFHGFFDADDLALLTVMELARRKGIKSSLLEDKNNAFKADFKSRREEQYNLLASTLRNHLDMKKIYKIMGL